LGIAVTMRTPFRPQTYKRAQCIALYLAMLVSVICVPSLAWTQTTSANGEWRDFEGIWTAVGKREVIPLGGDRQASITDFSGSLVLSGPSRPALGFRAEAIVLYDTLTGLVGRAVWTDERGDQVFSELRGETTASGNHPFGTLIGGSGRYAGATGSYEFSWRFLIETEDGLVQGQSVGLTGRVRAGPPPQGASAAGSSQR
jgi:hypothetical protein